MTFISRIGMLVLAAAPIAALAAPLTGTVTNKTTNKPSGGDTVILIALGQGMQEAARTTTDGHGKFTIDIPDSNMHLIRVDHQKAAYFQPAPPGTSNLSIDVYDVAPRVEGVSTEADVMRLETDQQGLHVIENFFVKNSSNPPRTQFSNQAYEIFLPEGAKIEGSAAMGPGGMPVASSPIPLAEKGHYAFVFPVRPGETRFQLSFHLPYNGSFKFTPKVGLPTENLAILLPKTMKFATSGQAFQPINDDVNAQTFLAKGVVPSAALDFTVSGTGSMPRESQNAGAQAGQAAQGAAQQGNAAAASEDTRPGGGLGNPIDTPDPLQKYKWWILSGLALVLAIAAAFLLRAKPGTEQVAAPPVPSPLTPTPRPGISNVVANPSVEPKSTLLSALKDELFSLETERLEGKLSDSEYAELKAALETVLRRALGRQTVNS